MIATIKGERVYGLDFYFYKMDLKGIPFDIEIEKEVTTLRAPYFGMSDKYGNGAILVRNSMYKPEDLEPCDKMADEKDYAELFKTLFGKYPNDYQTKEESYWQKGKPDCDGKYLVHYEDGTEEIAIRKHGCFYVLEETHRFGYSRIFAENGNDGGFGIVTDRKHIKINELVIAWHKIPECEEK